MSVVLVNPLQKALVNTTESEKNVVVAKLYSEIEHLNKRTQRELQRADLYIKLAELFKKLEVDTRESTSMIKAKGQEEAKKHAEMKAAGEEYIRAAQKDALKATQESLELEQAQLRTAESQTIQLRAEAEMLKNQRR